MESQSNIEGVLRLMAQIAPLPLPLQQRIASQLREEHFAPKEILLSPGETARRIYYVKKGFLRSYFIDPQGREHTTGFTGEGQLLTSTASFLLQQPSGEYLQALHPSQLLSLTYYQLQSYYADFPQGNLIGRIIAERHYAMSVQQSGILRFRSPRERYQALLERYPDIEQLTTTIHIASFLGINRETLSRTRSRLLRGSPDKGSAS